MDKTMNCPRCQKYIAPEFYCINCGHVPAKMQDLEPNNIPNQRFDHASSDSKTSSQASRPALSSK